MYHVRQAEVARLIVEMGDWATIHWFMWQRFGVEEAYDQDLFELLIGPF